MSNLKVGHLDGRARSKGCLSCIRMKVRCDQAIPSCHRCLRARRECPGYRPSTTTFVIQSGDGSNSSSSSRQHVAAAQASRATSLSAPLSTDWTDHAVTHYMHQFVVPTSDGLPGMHENLPELYSKTSSTEYLQKAVRAVAMANFARVRHMAPEYAVMARRLYGESIGGLRIALDNVGERSSPTALMTTELLTEHDLISGHATSSRASLHQEGMIYILRGLLTSNSGETDSLTQGAFDYILVQSLLKATHQPPPLELYPSSLPAAGSTNIVCNFLPLIYEAVTIRHAMSSATERLREEGALYEDLSRLDDALLGWEKSMPDGWRYMIVSRGVMSAVDNNEWLQNCALFTSIGSMMLWNVFWMTRLSVLLCLDEVHSRLRDRRFAAQNWATMCEIIVLICMAVPHMTGRIVNSPDNKEGVVDLTSLGSLFALRSLQMAGQCACIPEERRLWIHKELEFLGRHRGVG